MAHPCDARAALTRALIAVLAVAVDLPRQALMGLVRLYRLLLKPWLGSACRFEPTCSAYTLLALQQHGAFCGVALGGWRLLRCQPWCEGGHDPVPASMPRLAPGLFSRLGLHDATQALPSEPKDASRLPGSLESSPAPVSPRNLP